MRLSKVSMKEICSEGREVACRSDTATRTGRKKASYQIGSAAMVFWYQRTEDAAPSARR